MSLLKPKGRNVRVEESLLPLMDRLRACMSHRAVGSPTTEACGLEGLTKC